MDMAENNKNYSRERLYRLLLAAMFVAIAYLMRFVFHFKLSFLTFEVKDAFITIAGLFLGPWYALVMSFLLALLEFLTLSETGVAGLIMNFVAAASFSFVASIVYKYKRNFTGAIVGVLLGVVSLVVVMLPTNLIVTPIYNGVPVQVVLDMFPTLLLPFNLIKGVVNASIVFLLYRPLISAVRRAGLLPASKSVEGSNTKKTIIVSVIALVVLAIALFVFFYVFKGQYIFGKGSK